MEMTKEEKQYWKGLVSTDSVLGILEKREDRQSTVHDISRVFKPEGDMPRYLTQLVSNIIHKQKKKGRIVYIKKSRIRGVGKTPRWHFRLAKFGGKPNPLSVKQKKKKRTWRKKGRKRLYKIEETDYVKELMEYAEKRNTRFKFITAFRAITGIQEQTGQGKAYKEYQTMYHAVKLLAREGYLAKIRGPRYVEFELRKSLKGKKKEPAKKKDSVKMKVTGTIKITSTSMTVEILQSNLSDRTKVEILKKLLE